MAIIFSLILVALIIVPVYIFSSMRKRKLETMRVDWLADQEYTVFRIDVPRNNEKSPLAAEQMFASLHGIYSESSPFQPQLSFEIVARDKYIQFFVHVPVHLKDFVIGQIYAQYPTVEIKDVPEYIGERDLDQTNFAICEIQMTKPDVYPIKLFGDFEVDPISGITSVLTNLGQNEEIWLQVVTRPVGDEWQERGHSIISAVRSGKKSGGSGWVTKATKSLATLAKMILLQIIKPGAELAEEVKKDVVLPGTVEEALKAIEFKITKLGFETKIRVLSIASDPVTAKVKCQNLAAAFKQFNTTNMNGFKIGDVSMNDKEKWREYSEREFEGKGNTLNICELASLYHFPHQNVSTPNIVWSGSKKAEPPANLPLREIVDSKELTVIGETTFRNTFKQFGIKRDDRRRHIYIVGKSGVGKSVLIENMAVDDITEGRGVIIIDPHGDLADKALSVVPDHRIQDVIVFDPSDRAFPIAFNLLEHVEDDFKGMVASGFVGIFKKIFGDSWGPRLEHILRNTVLALLDFPDSTMLDIPKMLTENRFRDKVVEKVKDPVIRDFWVNEFAQYDSKFRTEAVSPILNKVGQFLSTATIRNIVGQAHSKIDIRQIMDQQKIMIVNLSRGKIGEDNSALLGAMMVTKVQLAAMSRADVTIDKRPDSYLYVDEFQNFATESFATILAEARKYNLNLTIANQYIAQLPEEVRDAVFGNAGTLLTFRVGGADADFLVKEYEPVFDANDLVNLDKYNIYIKLLIDGISSPAFSARTLPPVQKLTGNAEKVVAFSREHYSNPRFYVEEQISQRANQEETEMREEAELFKKGGLQALLSHQGSTSDSSAAPSLRATAVSAPVPTPAQTPASVPTRDTAPAPVVRDHAFVGVQKTILPNVAPADKPVLNEDSQSSEQAGEIDTKKNKPRVLRYQNIIGDKLYKEQTARGGVKWYVGEDIDEEKWKEAGLEVTDQARKMIKLAEKVAGSKAAARPVDQKAALGSAPIIRSSIINQESVKTSSETKGSKDNETKEIKKEAPVFEQKLITDVPAESGQKTASEAKPENVVAKAPFNHSASDLREGESVSLSDKFQFDPFSSAKETNIEQNDSVELSNKIEFDPFASNVSINSIPETKKLDQQSSRANNGLQPNEHSQFVVPSGAHFEKDATVQQVVAGSDNSSTSGVVTGSVKALEEGEEVKF
ncbi:MAG: DUF87 domain-containing protein [Patescibacteria group bacterium]